MTREPWSEERLNALLTEPSPALIEDMARFGGDVIILGAGGKMGPTLALLLKRAFGAAAVNRRVIAVSRFSDKAAARILEENGVELVSADLMERGALDKLPDARGVVYMAGRKFGTAGQEHLTWAMNAALPAMVAERYASSDIVVFSSGNIYPYTPPALGGADEGTPPAPVGEYAMSVLARERLFEHAAAARGARVCLYRLNYAVDLRYGVLYDLCERLMSGAPIPLGAAAFNCIWQGAANEMALRCLLHCHSPANVINVTGPETVSVRRAAGKLGAYLGKTPVFEGAEAPTALLNNAGKAMELFGYPCVSLETLLRWQAEWVLDGGRALGKPTHFEQREGTF